MLEAIASGHELVAVYVEDAARGSAVEAARAATAAGIDVIPVAAGALGRVADAQHPQGVLAEAALPLGAIGDLGAGLVLVCHDVADPGNLGTAIRCADAAGAAGVVVSGQSADPTGPKALRASAGGMLHLPVVESERLQTAAGSLRSAGRAILGAVVQGGAPLFSVPLADDVVIVVGGEARGLDADALGCCDATVSIPMHGRAESLNVGVAAGLCCFEWRRRREAGGAPSPTI